MSGDLCQRSSLTIKSRQIAEPAPPRNNIFSSSIILAQYSLFLQIILRIITFVLNGLAYRNLDADVLGIVNFRLGLFYSTVIFAARESFRKACLSRGGELLSSSPFTTPETTVHGVMQRKRLWHGLLNVMWLTVPVGCAVITFLLPVWLYMWPSQTSDLRLLPHDLTSTRNQYTIASIVYSFSALLELSTEPLWLICQLGFFVRSRIAIEAAANIARAVFVVVGVCFCPRHYGLLILACPQIAHASTLVIGYLIFFTHFILSKRDRGSHELPINSYKDILPSLHYTTFDSSCIHLSWSFFRQGILKQFLTEGERYLISAFHLLSFADQGIYDLVNNLGSLAPRLLFIPVEDTCHLLFSQCISRELPPCRQQENLLKQAFSMLKTGLRVTSLLAWLGFVFSQAYSRPLLFVYGGNKLSSQDDAVNLLRLFSFYLILLAWNGPTEAFLNAAMTTKEVNAHNRRLGVFSVLFLCSSGILVPSFGAAGFILANCINILVRVIYSRIFFNKFLARLTNDVAISDKKDEVDRFSSFSQSSLSEFSSFSLIRIMFPSRKQLVALLFSAVFTIISERYFCAEYSVRTIIPHICIGALSLLIAIRVILSEELETLKPLMAQNRIFRPLLWLLF